MATDIVKDCVFCSIANGGANLIWENDYAAAFATNDPKAQVHLLVVPKAHVENLNTLDDPELAGRLLLAVAETARVAGVDAAYKVIINGGSAAIVRHLHIHILGRKDGAAFSTVGLDL